MKNMTAKMRTVTAREYLDAEKPAFAQAHRDRLISALRAMNAPRDVIAEVVARIEQSSDTEIEAMVMRAGDEHDEITRTAMANVVTAIYRGDCETAVWLVMFAAANGEASVRDMLADFDASAVLAQARDVVSERQK